MQGKRVFPGAVAAVLFAAMCAYVLARFAAGTASGVRSSPECAQPPITLTGVVIRTEECISSARGCCVTAKNGQRRRAGAVLAMAEDGDEIYFDTAGVFYADTDGYEHFTPDILTELDAAGLSALLSSPPRAEEGAVGRVITGFCWYYVALLPDGVQPPDAQEWEVYFPEAGVAARGRVMRTLSGGRTGVILRFTTALTETAHLRFAEGQIAAD